MLVGWRPLFDEASERARGESHEAEGWEQMWQAGIDRGERVANEKCQQTLMRESVPRRRPELCDGWI